ncbi:unnamed protein product [Oppiella nova]|uniref:Uncharacterized protein n=1 Tax=Oppiella nova TaxID=334625 RepID=A0A7R9MDH8_9ACAR|nr:unnamed protein product [Oppiella nova]CAG2175347.1 unnamed protein product [Oppiella nova]
MNSFVAFVLLLTISKGLSDTTQTESIDSVVNGEDINIIKESEDGSDPTIVFSETINSATKLLYDLDVHVQQLVPVDTPAPPPQAPVSGDEIGGRDDSTTTQEAPTSEPQIYSAINRHGV